MIDYLLLGLLVLAVAVAVGLMVSDIVRIRRTIKANSRRRTYLGPWSS